MMSILNNLIRDKIFPALAHQLATSVLFLPKNKNKREKIIISESGGGGGELHSTVTILATCQKATLQNASFTKQRYVYIIFLHSIYLYLSDKKKSLYLRVEKTSDVKSTQIAHSILFQPR